MNELILTSHCSATRGLLATDHVILNHGQVTWTTPELAPLSNYHTNEDISALDRFNVHRCPTRRVFSGTGLEPVTKQATEAREDCLALAACHNGQPDCTLSAAVRPWRPENLKHTKKRRNRQGLYDKYTKI
ncbi:uncharacterized protein TNCV_2762841 [Trichonephila clavipes]|nr:uncharacterized protein TNCV_2762841 [Trichonephila clavipes]